MDTAHSSQLDAPAMIGVSLAFFQESRRGSTLNRLSAPSTKLGACSVDT
jgi:hypothetical protein